MPINSTGMREHRPAFNGPSMIGVLRGNPMKLTERQFRDALGQFTTGVCVVTAAPEGSDAVGVTVNSFTSVSITPPLILWCLKVESVVYSAFAAADRFAVNVLAANQKELSEQYADKTRHRLEPGCYVTGAGGAPVLNNAISSLSCVVRARYSGGDHVIILGEIMDITANPGAPLVFFQGRYRELKP